MKKAANVLQAIIFQTFTDHINSGDLLSTDTL